MGSVCMTQEATPLIQNDLDLSQSIHLHEVCSNTIYSSQRDQPKPLSQGKNSKNISNDGSPISSDSSISQDSNLRSQVLNTYTRLNKLPLNMILIKVYNKCRIERPVKTAVGTYVGQWSQSKQCGFGRLYYENGDYYEGFWLMNQKHHHGMYIYKNGKHQVGSWFSDKFMGEEVSNDDLMVDYKLVKYASIVKSTQCIERQDYKLWNTIDKEFTYIEYNNGNKYFGSFINNEFDGYGVFVDVDKIYTYRGYFRHNKKSGIGHYKTQKSIFIGLFDNDQQSANGFVIQI